VALLYQGLNILLRTSAHLVISFWYKTGWFGTLGV
jgi:hypothetical protein